MMSEVDFNIIWSVVSFEFMISVFILPILPEPEQLTRVFRSTPTRTYQWSVQLIGSVQLLPGKFQSMCFFLYH